MNNTSPKDWHALGKRFVIFFMVAMLFAVFMFFSSAFVPENRQGILFIGAAVVLWCSCAWIAFRVAPIIYLLVVAIGLTWGFLFSMSMAISIMNHRISVNWPTMIPGLLLIPVVATITVLPFRYFGRIILKKEKKEPKQ